MSSAWLILLCAVHGGVSLSLRDLKAVKEVSFANVDDIHLDLHWQTNGSKRQCFAKKSFCLDDKAVPRLYVLGSAKAGSTSLWQDINFGMVHPGLAKEARRLYPVSYKAYSDEARDKWLNTEEGGWMPKCNDVELPVAEATPSYLASSKFPNLLSNLYGPAASQKITFVVSLREPVARMHSHYHYYASHGFSPGWGDIGKNQVDSFAKFMQQNHEYIKSHEDLSQSFGEHEEGSVWSLGMKKSLYGANLKEWLDVFHPSQFIISPLKTYIKDTYPILSAIAEKTELDCSGLEGTSPPHANPTGVTGYQRPELSEDMDKVDAGVKEGISKLLDEDLNLLSKLLANGIKDGMKLIQYEGAPEADEVKKFLQQNW